MEENKTDVKCFHCKKSVGADESFCYGCKVYICEDCDTNNNMPMGPHKPEAHLADEEDEDGE